MLAESSGTKLTLLADDDEHEEVSGTAVSMDEKEVLVAPSRTETSVGQDGGARVPRRRRGRTV